MKKKFKQFVYSILSIMFLATTSGTKIVEILSFMIIIDNILFLFIIIKFFFICLEDF